MYRIPRALLFVALALLLLLSVHDHISVNASRRRRGRTKGMALSDEKRLIKHLLDNYERVGIVGRPVMNMSQTIVVHYGLALIQILDLDEKNQVLTTNCWSRYLWTDIMLEWDPADYGGVDNIRVPTSKIWTPDIVLYNYADDRLKEHRDAYAVVSNNGGVMWIPQAIFKSSCVIDITHFPFDEQECTLKFGSWTYDGFKLDIEFYDNLQETDLNDYIPSNEWDMLDHPASRNVKYYPCCREPYPDLTFRVRLRRKVAFYNYILILPCVLLSSLTLVLFWLPPESPAKMVLGMNIFVAFFVLLLLLAESTPPAASSIPLIGAYYCLNMIMITLSTFLSVIVINLYFRGDKRNKVPYWLKKVFIDWLARILCMRSELIPEGYDTNYTRPSKTSSSQRRHSKHKKRVKSPEMAYNKFQMYDLKDEPAAAATFVNHQGNNTTTTTTTTAASTAAARAAAEAFGSMRGVNIAAAASAAAKESPDKSPEHGRHQSVECDVREIRRYLRSLLVRIHQKEERGRVAIEWRIVAVVLDRMFFFMYLIAIIVSLVTMFPKTSRLMPG